MTSTISIAVIDDHPLFREGVTRSLGEAAGLTVAGEGSNAADALEIAGRVRPDVLLLDISMPGGGLNAVSAILASHPQQKIIMLTVSEASEDVTAALKAGAKGYVLKGVGSRALADIIRTVAGGESYVAPTLSARLLTSTPEPAEPGADALKRLTSRERDVLILVAQGLSNKAIGLKLDLHEKTVKHHMTQIFSKLQVSNRTEAALAYRGALQGPAAERRSL